MINAFPIDGDGNLTDNVQGMLLDRIGELQLLLGCDSSQAPRDTRGCVFSKPGKLAKPCCASSSREAGDKIVDKRKEMITRWGGAIMIQGL